MIIMRRIQAFHFSLFSALIAALLVAGCSYTIDRRADAASCDARSASIYYDEWEYELSAESHTVLKAFQNSYKGCNLAKVRIVGMADSVGDEEENLKVSQQRAEVIANELAAGGWDRSRFDIIAIGKRGAEVDGVKKTMRRRAVISVEASPS